MINLNLEIKGLLTEFDHIDKGPSSFVLKRLQSLKYDDASTDRVTSELFNELVKKVEVKGAIKIWAIIDVIVQIGAVVTKENTKYQDFWLVLLVSK